jgi:hypothetical protein
VSRRIAAIFIAAVALVALTAAPLSNAALPRPGTAKIVRFVHIGGVKLEMGKAKVSSLWGAPDLCDTPNRGTVTCVWQQHGEPDLPPQGASVDFHHGKACWVRLFAGINPQGGLTITKFKRWRTREGIGLGSYLSKVKNTYGGLQGSRRGVSFTFSSGYRGPSLKKVAEISLRGSGPCFTA